MFVYAIYNRGRDKIYIGQTINIFQRLERHNGTLKNKAKSFTSKNNGHWELIYQEKLKTRSDAIKREKELKSAKGREFIRNLISPP